MTVPRLERAMQEMPVLCVDVDGTLLRTDLLLENLLELIIGRPWLLPLVPFWLMRGRAYLKERLARTSVANFRPPFEQRLFQFLKSENDRGRRLVLCSASNEHLVRKVAAQLGMPAEVLASNSEVNLKGRKKALVLVERFGSRGFDYAGNSSDDLPVWHHARNAIVVNASPRVETAARMDGNVTMVFSRTGSVLRAIARTVRPPQWIKNLLVFVPLLASHRFLELELLGRGAVAFFSMSLCASSIYILNDLADISSDRAHPSKQNRPFASGELSISVGLVLGPLLWMLGIFLSLVLSKDFMLFVLIYSLLAIAYTFFFKRKLVADVIVLALLYTIRIIAGGVATLLAVTPWLLAFSLFLFLSLAFSKRVTELVQFANSERPDVAGRGYFGPDASVLTALGVASGCLACLILSLYINSGRVRGLYPHPAWLWLEIPLLLNWIGRFWVKTARGRMSEDPIRFVTKDYATYLTLLCAGLLLLLASKFPFGILGIEE